MAKAKPKVTRTYGPIHFEDLDPHRFEDLVRELIYDYRDWQSIEATGRGGSDDGFDIRAYEKLNIAPADEGSEEAEQEAPQPMEGNLWMIQGKREKEIGPKRVRSIVADIDKKNPPYGYILTASANFSKESYDVFREELRKNGVMEFYLWGKAELEDMLHFPKNDRILFTFFGISLVSKRKSRVAEVRASVIIKNKLYRVLGEGQNLYKSILIRDIKDTHYPYKGKHRDFEKKPRWKEYVAYAHHPLGVWAHGRKYFAYVDTKKKEWDFTKEVDLVNRQVQGDDDRQMEADKREKVEAVWDFFQRANQAHFSIDGLVEYADVLIVDDKGDDLYNFPHIYVDFVGEKGPFSWFLNNLEVGGQEFHLPEDYKRIKVFPDKFAKPTLGKIHMSKPIVFDAVTIKEFKEYGKVNALYDSDNKYAFLNPRDIVPVEGEDKDTFIEVTHKFKSTIKTYIEETGDTFSIRRSIQQQLGRDFDEKEEINIYEIKRVYKWYIDKQKGKE